ncbi:MAG: carboxypeptidase regulatory-like domain-containing protein [Pseudomonadota bacterium]
MIRRWAAALTLTVTLMTGWTGVAQAQQGPGGLDIDVRDARSGRPVPSATVALTARNGLSRQETSGADGRAELRELTAGLYELTVTADGYASAAEPSLRVVARKTQRIDVELVPRTAQVEEVLVSGRAVAADPFGSASASYLNREELRSAVGAGSDVMRALDGLPGLVSTGDFANFSVRGRGPRDNLIFVDGFPLDKVVHFDQTLGEEEDIGGGGRFSIFAPNAIAGAEFSPGGWSAAFGGRSGSLLQLEVAGGNPSPSATARIDIAGVELAYDGPSGFHDGTTIYATARQFDFGRVFDFIDEKDIGTPQLTDVILKTATELNARNTLETLLVLAPEEFERNVDNVLAAEDFNDTGLASAEQDLGLFGVTWRRLVGGSGEWTNRLYVRRSDKTSREGEAFPDLVAPGTPAAQVPVNENIISIEENEREIGWRSDYRQPNTWGELTAGLRATQIDLDFATVLREPWTRFVYNADDERPVGQDFIVLDPDDLNARFDESATSLAVFAEQLFEWSGVNLRAGLRVDRDGFSDETLFSPRLALNFLPSDPWRVSLTAGVFYQSPRFLDRGASNDNAQIESERTTHASVAITRSFGDDWSLLVEPYYQALDDLLVDAGRTDSRLTNSGDGQSYGVDIVLSRSFADGWWGNATYSFNRTRLNDNDGTPEYAADFSRDHFFSVGGSWEISDRWQVGARWKFATGRPTDNFLVNADVLGPGQPLRFSKEITERNTLELGNYHSLNVRVDYRRSLGPVNFIGFVDVINLYGGPGAQPDEFSPLLGRNIDEDDGAFPLIGIIFERTW